MARLRGGRAAEGPPSYMLNLIEFLPDGGAEPLRRVRGSLWAPLLERAGGQGGSSPASPPSL